MPRKQPQPEFFRDGDKYIALTGECPKDFPGFLFICFRGDEPGSVNEDVISKPDASNLDRIEGADVPDDWAEAFEKAGVKVPRPVATGDVTFINEPEIEPEIERPARRRPRKRRNSKEAGELFHGHMAAGIDPWTAAAASGYEFGEEDETDNEPLQLRFTAAEVVAYIFLFWAFCGWAIGNILQ